MTAPAGARRAARRAVRRWVADERGAAIVEFAVVMPVLLVFITAIIDFGRMYAISASLAGAVRDGARQAAASTPNPTTGAPRTAVQTRVVQAFQTFGGAAITTGDVAVTLDANNNVVVSVANYTFRPITPVATFVGLGRITITRTATFRWEAAT